MPPRTRKSVAISRSPRISHSIAFTLRSNARDDVSDHAVDVFRREHRQEQLTPLRFDVGRELLEESLLPVARRVRPRSALDQRQSREHAGETQRASSSILLFLCSEQFACRLADLVERLGRNVRDLNKLVDTPASEPGADCRDERPSCHLGNVGALRMRGEPNEASRRDAAARSESCQTALSSFDPT